MKLFMTGATGYVGHSLLSRLPENWKITALVRQIPVGERRSNCRYVRGNLTAPQSYANYLKNTDCVLHLAGVKGSGTCAKSPAFAIEANIWGTHVLLRQAIAQRAKRFIFASSYWVYGKENKPPFRESDTPRPHELYGLTKLISEKEIKDFGAAYVILRLGNVFGWNGNYQADDIVSTFVRRAFAGEPIHLDALSREKLDLIHIDDVCENVKRIVQKQSLSRAILNMGSGLPISASALAQKVAALFHQFTGRAATLRQSPERAHRLFHRWLSIAHMRRILNPQSMRPLDTSILEYISQYAMRSS